MTALPDKDKNRCRIHLGYTLDAVPDGNAFVLEDRMDNLRNLQEVQWIQDLLNKCDYAWNRMFLDDQATGIARTVVTVGDINRNETVNVSESMKSRQNAYKMAVECLGQQLAVPVFRWVGGGRLHSVVSRRRSLPRGPADTCRSDKLWLSLNYG
jgi:hypothetical protein